MSRSWRHQSLKRSRRCVLVGRPVLRSDNALLISLSRVHNERKVSVKKKKKTTGQSLGAFQYLGASCLQFVMRVHFSVIKWQDEPVKGRPAAIQRCWSWRGVEMRHCQKENGLPHLWRPLGLFPLPHRRQTAPFFLFLFSFFLKIVSVCVHETSFFPPFFSEGTIWSEYVKPLVHMKS